jgi:hypothetical protein
MPETKQVSDPQDISVRAIGWGAVAIVAGILFAIGVSYAAWRALGAGPGPNRATGGAQPAAPQLLAAPQPDKARYFAEKERAISSYGWVDRQAGIARIPVGEAMQLMAARAQAGKVQR